MITWIQRYFQAHFRTIFAVLLAATIISFVFTIGATPGIGRADRRVSKRQFFDYNLASQEDQQRMVGDASLSITLQLGYSGLSSDQVQNYAFQRAATLHLADELHLPDATTAEVTEHIKGLRMFAGTDGQFDVSRYNSFRDNLKAGARTSEGDILRVIAGDVRAEKVQKLLAGPGYVLPGDVAAQVARGDTTWTVALGLVDYASYNAGYTPTDADLAKFFDENSFRYEIAPRVVASYVEFSALPYLATITVTEAEVRAFYDANPSRFPKPATDPKAPAIDPAKADPAADYAAVRPQVEGALKLERAQRIALKQASDFSFDLYSRKIAPGAALDTVLAQNKLTPKAIAPFSHDEGPAELGRNPEISDEAFKLGASRYFSEALQTPAGAVVLLWKETQPARKPALAEVRDKVLADCVDNEKRKKFVELGRTLKTQLEARLKAGEAFDKAAAAVAAATSLKIETKTTAAFTPRSAPSDLDVNGLSAMERLEQGQLSDMSIGPDKGQFIFAVEKKAPDLSAANPRVAEIRTQLASSFARIGAGVVLGELVNTELKRGEPVVK